MRLYELLMAYITAVEVVINIIEYIGSGLTLGSFKELRAITGDVYNLPNELNKTGFQRFLFRE